VSDGLWIETAVSDLYEGDRKAYQVALLEQHKIYVEMADRISQRRGIANTFFLTTICCDWMRVLLPLERAATRGEFASARFGEARKSATRPGQSCTRRQHPLG
jgi:hypothetical protein